MSRCAGRGIAECLDVQAEEQHLYSSRREKRMIALSFIMVLCLLVYRLSECLLRRQLAATEQTVPNQVNKPN